MTTTPRPTLTLRDSPARERRLTGHAALLGLAMFLASLATFAPESAPDPGTATATVVRRFAIDNAGTIQVNTLAALATIMLLVIFVAILAQQVRQARPASIGPPVMVCLAGVIATQSLFLTAVSSLFARPEQLAGATDETVATLYQVTAVAEWLYTLTILVPCMALIATYSWLALRCQLITRWVCWAGFTIAAAGALTTITHIVPTLQLDTFLFPLFGWWLWPGMIGTASAIRWFRSR
ncbi:hypothetical protein GCM10023168_05590 [Fodinibacter luteus]|uniref:DUF4386 domain-containing protein n=1 Tax=Fodinibacter luteus TaxID=552064 RepID=A0ABP8K0T9_9MICO